MTKLIIGIDPGSHGAMSIATVDGAVRKVWGFSKNTEHDIKDIIQSFKEVYPNAGDIAAYIEEVHAMPKDGKVQAFSFGKNYGFWIGILTALEIPYYTVIPLKWQSALRLKVRGLEYREKKNALKANAQRMFPKLNPTLETSDALLIAEYGRQAALNELRELRGLREAEKCLKQSPE